ncbi:M20 metallopeptidase family protein [Anaerococcus hydrogenalis]|uniref:Amidohydrolase n=1 Tax=Anaerococcus hydrogenalis ACS-025-V-Sch4 TaxID=879306 RepID=F0H052_9FIRM|nr:amidohydrolase [Anaerococcus hydrogenalis]EGC84149.1 amidohydrolase [Anaerococcus hydrogenalis ACS-025-V-Sch4]
MVKDRIKKVILDNEESMIDFRRKMHENPELSMKEFETSKFIASFLDEMGISYRFANPTGIIGEIKGKSDKKTVLLRADIDALPILETNDVSYKSKNEGISHACGHDTHSAMLLTALKALNEVKDELDGNVRFVFQPGEETGEGSKAMVKDGLLDGVDNAFGAHIFTSFDSGVLGATYGQTFAANDFFNIHFKGLTSHGSTPQKGVDAMVMAATFILNSQAIISREIDLAEEPVVLTFGKIHGGEVANSICGDVYIEAGFRAFTQDSVDFVEKRLTEYANQVAKMYRGEVEIDFNLGAAPVVIDENSGKLTQKVAAEIVGEENVDKDIRFSGSEDFGLYLTGYDEVKGVKGSFGMIGARNSDPKTHNFNHASDFNVDESVLKNGAMMYALYAYEYLIQDEF